jgi:hypothetical protein
LAGFFVDGAPFDGKNLADMREVKIVVELGGGPDFSGLDAPVVGRVVDRAVGLFSVLKHQRHILKQRGLIGFDGEVVVGLALGDQVVGEFTLSEQRIGG